MKASFFDIDGTLTLKNMFLGTHFPKYLVSKGIFPQNKYEIIENLLQSYFENKITYREVASKLMEIYPTGLKNVSEKKVKKEADNFVKEVVLKQYMYPYTERLTKLMRKYGVNIGISGAPREVVVSLGKHFSFDFCYGTEAEIKNGVYTGKLKQNLVISEAKESLLNKLVKEKDIDLRKSFAFGDTGQDAPMLSKVGNPVALNPDKDLLDMAKDNGWQVFTSEDDIIGEISKKLERL